MPFGATLSTCKNWPLLREPLWGCSVGRKCLSLLLGVCEDGHPATCPTLAQGEGVRCLLGQSGSHTEQAELSPSTLLLGGSQMTSGRPHSTVLLLEPWFPGC